MEKREVIVIGAGLAGLLAAYYLQRAGKDVLVLEAAEAASGQTGRTTAKITSQHAVKYSKLIKQVGFHKAVLYARANEEAIREFKRLVMAENIDCDFTSAPAYLYTNCNPKILEEEAGAAELLNIDAFLTRETELPFEVKKALVFAGQAQFSPLKFVSAIAKKLEIREHTPVMDIKKNVVITREQLFMADHIVVATHYPIINVPGFYFLRQHQERSYVLALEGAAKIKGMYYGIDSDGISLRQEGDWMLLGGGSHRTGKKSGGYDWLECEASRYFPECNIAARWAAQDCIPHDGIPFIGRYSAFTPNMYVATGFQKWGMTTSMIAAQLLTDMICEKENPYEELFSPQRLNLWASANKFLMDAGESAWNLGKGLLARPRCPHMGCKLIWNAAERSWDCPCHGSRFDATGRLLDNPAKKDMNL